MEPSERSAAARGRATASPRGRGGRAAARFRSARGRVLHAPGRAGRVDPRGEYPEGLGRLWGCGKAVIAAIGRTSTAARNMADQITRIVLDRSMPGIRAPSGKCASRNPFAIDAAFSPILNATTIGTAKSRTTDPAGPAVQTKGKCYSSKAIQTASPSSAERRTASSKTFATSSAGASLVTESFVASSGSDAVPPAAHWTVIDIGV